MGPGVAKVDKHAVAQILRHEAAETAHGFSDAFMIGRDYFAQVFRVHPSRECGRTNEVGEHHRNLTALGSVRRSLGDSWRSYGSLGRAFEIRDRTQELPAMPERRDTNLFEILIGQVPQNIEVDIVLGKALGVLPESELFEPVRNWVHRRPSTDLTPSVLDRHVGRSLSTLAKIQ
jgi:hypothetical protein